MNQDGEALVEALLRLSEKPHILRGERQDLKDAVVLLRTMDRDLRLALYEVAQLRESRSANISEADKATFLSESGGSPTPQKRGRPSKKAQTDNDQNI